MRLFFVSGPHRSGTTMIAKWLANQPNATGLQETGVPEDEGIFLATPPFSIGSETDKPGDFALAKLNRMENCEATKAEILPKWLPYVKEQAEWLVEKSPVHCVQHKFLRKAFPKSYHLCVVRHPIPVVASTWKMQQAWGGTLSRQHIAHNWMEGIKTFMRDTAKDPNTGLLILNSNPKIPEMPIQIAKNIPYDPKTDQTYFKIRRDWHLPRSVVDFMEQFGFKDVKPYH